MLLVIDHIEDFRDVYCTQVNCTALLHIIINYIVDCSDSKTAANSSFKNKVITRADQKKSINNTMFKYFRQYRIDSDCSKVITCKKFDLVFFGFVYRHDVAVSKPIQNKRTIYH